MHTQNVESYNNKLKKRIKSMNGLTTHARKNALDEFMFIDLFKNTTFDEVLNILHYE